MTPVYATLVALADGFRVRLRALREAPERGSVSVEQVIITAALIGIAIALVVVIANAVTSRSADIQ
jgi:hypothetical protein